MILCFFFYKNLSYLLKLIIEKKKYCDMNKYKIFISLNDVYIIIV